MLLFEDGFDATQIDSNPIIAFHPKNKQRDEQYIIDFIVHNFVNENYEKIINNYKLSWRESCLYTTIRDINEDNLQKQYNLHLDLLYVIGLFFQFQNQPVITDFVIDYVTKIYNLTNGKDEKTNISIIYSILLNNDKHTDFFDEDTVRKLIEQLLSKGIKFGNDYFEAILVLYMTFYKEDNSCRIGRSCEYLFQIGIDNDIKMNDNVKQILQTSYYYLSYEECGELSDVEQLIVETYLFLYSDVDDESIDWLVELYEQNGVDVNPIQSKLSEDNFKDNLITACKNCLVSENQLMWYNKDCKIKNILKEEADHQTYGLIISYDHNPEAIEIIENYKTEIEQIVEKIIQGFCLNWK